MFKMFQINTDKNDFPLTQEWNWTYVVAVFSNIFDRGLVNLKKNSKICMG
jgi:hypothetical protein